MKKIILIVICALILISATVVEVSTMIIQPKCPKEIKVINGYLYLGRGESDLEAALNTYKNMGFIIKTSNYNNNGIYLIILEKY